MHYSPSLKSLVGRGFALPTVLITSIAMMIVLLAAVQSAGSIRVALDEQYYSKLARLAAESGAAAAQACLKQSQTGQALWTGTTSELKPNMNCQGQIVSGSSQYVLDTAAVKTSFSVRITATNSEGLPLKASAEGSVSRYRQSTGTVWQTSSSTLAMQLDRSSIEVSTLSSGVEATCASVGGRAYCWGNRANGRLGI